jgi:hypothetical protein
VAHDVFVSYSSKDKPTADAVCATLEGAGIRCWIAPRDIAPGADWSASIVTAIERARVMVLVFSAHANDSQQIKREVERAVHKGVAVIPLRINDVMPAGSLEYFLSTPHWLDAFSPPLERHLQYLAAVISQIIERDPSAPAPTPTPPAADATGSRGGRGRHKLLAGAALAGLALLGGAAGIRSWLKPQPQPNSVPVIGGPVLFARDQVVLVPSADETIAAQARFLHDNPDVKVAVVASCPKDQGTAGRPWVLAELRANRVRDALEAHGVAGDRLTTENACKAADPTMLPAEVTAARDGQVYVLWK